MTEYDSLCVRYANGSLQAKYRVGRYPGKTARWWVEMLNGDRLPTTFPTRKAAEAYFDRHVEAVADRLRDEAK